MGTTAHDEGLYVAFPVAPDRELRRFINDIPHYIGEPIDVETAHITAMYPEELAVRGLARHERRELYSSVRPVLRALSVVGLAGSEVMTCYDTLVDRKKFVALELEPSEEMLEARSRVAETISKRLHIVVPTFSPNGWHLSVARRGRRGGRIPPHKKPLPDKVTISGVEVSIRRANGMMDSQTRRYVNKPKNRRYK